MLSGFPCVRTPVSDAGQAAIPTPRRTARNPEITGGQVAARSRVRPSGIRARTASWHAEERNFNHRCTQMHTDAWCLPSDPTQAGRTAVAAGPVVPLGPSVCICVHLWSNHFYLWPPASRVRKRSDSENLAAARGLLTAKPPATLQAPAGQGRSCPPGGQPATVGTAIPPEPADRTPRAATESNPIRPATSLTQGKR